jgi:hypothetical protein
MGRPFPRMLVLKTSVPPVLGSAVLSMTSKSLTPSAYRSVKRKHDAR